MCITGTTALLCCSCWCVRACDVCFVFLLLLDVLLRQRTFRSTMYIMICFMFRVFSSCVSRYFVQIHCWALLMKKSVLRLQRYCTSFLTPIFVSSCSHFCFCIPLVFPVPSALPPPPPEIQPFSLSTSPARSPLEHHVVNGANSTLPPSRPPARPTHPD